MEILSQTLFASRILDHRYINPVLGINDARPSCISLRFGAGAHENGLTTYLWQQSPSSVIKIQILFRLAKIIQYLHSMDVVLDDRLRSHDVRLDSDLNPKICCLYSTSQSLLDKECKERFSPHENIFSFGGLCYELYAGADTWPDYPVSSRRRVIPKRPSQIPKNAWQLIQRCCAEDSKCRPTIDEVVMEIGDWDMIGHVELSLREPSLPELSPQEPSLRVPSLREPSLREPSLREPSLRQLSLRDRTCFGALCSVLSDLGRSLCQ
ncbi:hypothetical protein JOM56_009165 [Amanita muscaria]